MDYIKFFWKPAAWGFFVIILSAIDTTDMSRPRLFNFQHFDKVLHFTMYLIFTYLLIADMIRSGITGDYLYISFLLSASAIVFFGGAVEILQMIPVLHRNASFSDFFANTAGAVTAVVLFRPVKQIIAVVIRDQS